MEIPHIWLDPVNGWSSLGSDGCQSVLFVAEGASLVARMVKNLPTMQETWVCSLGQEDPLEKGMGTHSSILAWRIPWAEEPGGLPMESQSRTQLK